MQERDYVTLGNKPPNSRRNLDIAIDRILEKKSNPLQIRTIIANTIIGQLLPKGAVKGGSALKFRYGDKATRFSRDFDAARGDELDSFIDGLQSSLQIGWNGFTGRIIKKEPAKPKNVPGEYIMQPFEIKLSYNGKSWLTVPLEVGHDEIGDTENPDYYISHDIVNFFKLLGFPEPMPIALMPIHHQVAQKIHALSLENSERAHDLIDLQVIVSNEALDLHTTRTICQRLFVFRNLQQWPPNIQKNDMWDTLYENQTDGLDVLQTVDEAVSWANALIKDIDGA